MVLVSILDTIILYPPPGEGQVSDGQVISTFLVVAVVLITNVVRQRRLRARLPKPPGKEAPPTRSALEPFPSDDRLGGRDMGDTRIGEPPHPPRL